MMADETGGAEGEESEDPIHRPDNRCAYRAGGQRLGTQSADHGGLANIQQWLARLSEHRRNAEGEDIAQVGAV